MSETLLKVTSSAVSSLLDKLPFSFAKQLDEWSADAIRSRRLHRLVQILEEAHTLAEQRGLSVESMRVLADHVGLPWVEKATLHDDADLRTTWASLFVSMTTDSKLDVHATYVSILGEMTSLDCKVLEYIVTHGLVKNADDDDGLVLVPLSDDDIRKALSRDGCDEGRIQISVESLVRQACLIRIPPAPLRPGISMYGGLPEVISATTLGMNFFSAASGTDLSTLAPVLSEDQIKERIGIVEVTRSGDRFPAVALASSIRVG